MDVENITFVEYPLPRHARVLGKLSVLIPA
jgi:hypothetical protein